MKSTVKDWLSKMSKTKGVPINPGVQMELEKLNSDFMCEWEKHEHRVHLHNKYRKNHITEKDRSKDWVYAHLMFLDNSFYFSSQPTNSGTVEGHEVITQIYETLTSPERTDEKVSGNRKGKEITIKNASYIVDTLIYLIGTINLQNKLQSLFKEMSNEEFLKKFGVNYDGTNFSRREYNDQIILLFDKLKSAATLDPELTEDKALTRTQRKARDSALPDQIKALYNNSCAICGISLLPPSNKKISPKYTTEAQCAHIFPVSEGGRDDVRNAICLCRLHHWAFDVGWFTISDNHTIIIRNDLPREEQYTNIRKYAGKKLVIFPPIIDLYPHSCYLTAFRKKMGFE